MLYLTNKIDVTLLNGREVQLELHHDGAITLAQDDYYEEYNQPHSRVYLTADDLANLLKILSTWKRSQDGTS